MKVRLLTVVFILIAALVASFVWRWELFNRHGSAQTSLTPNQTAVETPRDIKSVIIDEGSSFGAFAVAQGLSPAESMAIYEATKPVYDLADIKAGQIMNFKYLDNQIIALYYDVNYDQILTIVKSGADWSASLEQINYQITERVITAQVESSLYEAGLKAGLDEGLIIEMADAFQWALDFSMDVRAGDSFKVVYEERQRDGRLASPGRILSAYYINEGQRYELYYYQSETVKGAYYDDQGRAAPKKFLKAPVSFRYISSGFTTNSRYVGGQFQVFTKNHMAIDYAASQGTPIRAVADGKVRTAGWKSGYGNFISIRHDGTYTTNYGHLSKIKVKNGQSVTQGQIIGLVGSTGFSTGPHLHYEMSKNGTLINPLKEVSPPGEPIGAGEMNAFNQVKDKYRGLMGI